MNPGLRAELLRRMERDQVARRADDLEAFGQVDAENLPWLKKVITVIGWPGRSIVGDDGASAAWLLVQHADSDPAFQRQCLELLTVAASHGEATKAQVAYLTDRVLLAEGEPQEFGTQAIGRNGQWLRVTFVIPATSISARRPCRSAHWPATLPESPKNTARLPRRSSRALLAREDRSLAAGPRGAGHSGLRELRADTQVRDPRQRVRHEAAADDWACPPRARKQGHARRFTVSHGATSNPLDLCSRRSSGRVHLLCKQGVRVQVPLAPLPDFPQASRPFLAP
jgi:hypothetical protein